MLRAALPRVRVSASRSGEVCRGMAARGCTDPAISPVRVAEFALSTPSSLTHPQPAEWHSPRAATWPQAPREEAMRIFVAGGTGAVGSRLVPLLAAKGHTVVATTRSPDGTSGGSTSSARSPWSWTGSIASRSSTPSRARTPMSSIHQMTGAERLHRHQALRRRVRADEPPPRSRGRTISSRRRRRPVPGGWSLRASATGTTRAPARRSSRRKPARSRPAGRDAQEPRRDRVPRVGGHGLRVARRHRPALRESLRPRDGLERGWLVRGTGAHAARCRSSATERRVVVRPRRRRRPRDRRGGRRRGARHLQRRRRRTGDASRSGCPRSRARSGPRPPRRIPRWLGRLAVGDVGVSFFTQIRGAANAKARRELKWEPPTPAGATASAEGFRPRRPNPGRRLVTPDLHAMS